MQRTIKYKGWPIETKKPQDNNNNNDKLGENTPKTETHRQNGKPKTEKHYQKTETQIPERK